ncbi:MAG: hypothetical protein ACI31M_00925 [Bacilli bacterium]
MKKDKLKVTSVQEGIVLGNIGRVSTKALTVAGLSAVIIISLGSTIGLAIHNNARDEVKYENDVDYQEYTEPEYIESAVSENEVIEEDTNETYSVVGSFVDNHNQELYISGLDEAREIDNGQSVQNTGNNSANNNGNQNSNRTNNGTNNSSNPINGIEVNGGENVSVTQNNNTIINNNNGYQDEFAANQGLSNNSQTGQDSAIGSMDQNNGLTIPAPIEEVNVINEEELVYEGYVMHKLNYEQDGLWISFYESNGTINANIEDASILSSKDVYNSNIYGISYTQTMPGWEYVCPNDREHQDLGLAVDYEVICDGLVEMYNNAIANGEFNVEEGTELRK